MGFEVITLFLSFTTLAIFLLLLGRLVATVLKILILALALIFILSRLDAHRVQICAPGARPIPFISDFLCR